MMPVNGFVTLIGLAATCSEISLKNVDLNR
jgi:hypothetical protein